MSGATIGLDTNVALPREPACDRCDVLDHRRELHALGLEIDLSRFHLRQIEDVVDQLKKMPCAFQDKRAELGILRRHGPESRVDHHLGEPDDRVERRAQLVRHVGDEFSLQPAAFLDAAVFDFEHLPECSLFTSLCIALRFQQLLVPR